MGQSHFMLALPLMSGRAAATMPHALAPLFAELFAAADKLGTVHYSYFVVPDDRTLLFLAHFDDDFGDLMSGLALHASPTFDAILRHVAEPPPLPVSEHRDAFVAWTRAHLVQPLSVYSAYPAAGARIVRSLRSKANSLNGNPAAPFAVLVPAKSHLAFLQMQLFLRSVSGRIARDLDAIGATHFMQIAPLDNDCLGYFSVYDGSFGEYADEMTKSSTFDAVLKFATNPPPSPSWRHREEFVRFIVAARREPFGFYSANPGLSVAEITKRSISAVGSLG